MGRIRITNVCHVIDIMRLQTDVAVVRHIAKAASYPPLTPQQITKLKYLTLASMATQNRVSPCYHRSHHILAYVVIVQILPYSTLLADLEISSIRELEDLIIDAIYQDIVRGKLDQKEQQFEVEFTMGRDLQVSQLPALLDELKNWYVRLRIPTYFRYRQPAGHVAQLV